MEFMQAEARHLEELCRITGEAKAQLKGLGLDQWQLGYPNQEVWTEDIRQGTAWVAVEDGRVLGAFRVQTTPELSYAEIDGAWLTDGAYGSLHRVCVADAAKGRGVAGALFRQGLALTAAAGLPALRIDTHPGNLPMRRALDKAGFTHCGTIVLREGCEAGGLRRAYELLLQK